MMADRSKKNLLPAKPRHIHEGAIVIGTNTLVVSLNVRGKGKDGWVAFGELRKEWREQAKTLLLRLSLTESSLFCYALIAEPRLIQLW